MGIHRLERLGGLLGLLAIINAQSGVFQTENGYDTLKGSDAICWRTEVQGGPNGTTTEEDTELLRRCPDGNSIQSRTPNEDGRLRTETWYNYSADISINLTSWGIQAEGGMLVSATVIACEVGVSAGLCSPFLAKEIDSFGSEEDDSLVIQSETILQYIWSQNNTIYQLEMELPMMVNSTGNYVLIVALRMDFDKTQIPIRIDMSNALQPSALISFQNAPHILTVSQGIRYGAYTVVGIAGAMLLYLLLQIFIHQKHVSLKMGQAKFLMAFLLAGLSAVCCSILLEPRNDLYCRLGLPTVFVSLQLFYAITVGRVWRIHSVISPAILQSMDWNQQDAWVQSFIFGALRKYTSCMLTWDNRNRPKRLHKTFTEKQLVMVVVLFTLPQVIIQALAVYFQPWRMAVEFNENESIGRQYCALPEDLPYKFSIFYYGMYMFVILLLLLFAMARTARGLPSLFNESRIIFDSLTSSIFLLVLGMGVIFGTSSPTTSPAVPYIVGLVLILFVTLQSSLQLVLPKLKLAWKGEIIVVSNLVTEHSKHIRNKRARRESRKARRKGSSSCSSLGAIDSEELGGKNGRNIHISGLELNASLSGQMSQMRRFSTATFSEDQSFKRDLSSGTLSIDVEAARSRPNAEPFKAGEVEDAPRQSSEDQISTDFMKSSEPQKPEKQETASSMDAGLPDSGVVEPKLPLGSVFDERLRGTETAAAATETISEEKSKLIRSSAHTLPPELNQPIDQTEEKSKLLRSSVHSLPKEIDQSPLSPKSPTDHRKSQPLWRSTGGRRPTWLRRSFEPSSPPRDSNAKPGNRFSMISMKKKRPAQKVSTSETQRPKNEPAILKALDLEILLQKLKKKVFMGLEVTDNDWKKVREVSFEMEKLLVDAENNDDSVLGLLHDIEADTSTVTNVEIDNDDGSEDENDDDDLDSFEEEKEGKEAAKMRRSSRRRPSHVSHKFLHKQPGNQLLDPVSVLAVLGQGPMRFANPRRSVHVQVASLSEDDQESFRLLRSDWHLEEAEILERKQRGLAGGIAMGTLGLANGTIGLANDGARQALGLGKNTIGLANTGARQAYGLTKTGAKQAYGLTRTGAKQAMDLTKTASKQAIGLTNYVAKPITGLATSVARPIASVLPSAVTTGVAKSGQVMAKSGQAMANGLSSGVTRSGQAVASGFTSGIAMSGQAVALSGQAVATGLTTGVTMSGHAMTSSGKAVARSGKKITRFFRHGQQDMADGSVRSSFSNQYGVSLTGEIPSMSGEMILRFLRMCPEDDPEEKQLATWRAMTRFDLRYLALTARTLEQQILTKVIFPIPGLKTCEDNAVFYVRPSRHNPFLKSNATFIDTLVYCIQTMLEDELACVEGISLIAYMDGFTMKNYTPDFWLKFMQTLEGHVTPVRISQFFIVNAPLLFSGVSTITKTMVSAEFYKKIQMVSESKLGDYLMQGYEEYLPDDMATGKASTDEMVNDWITFRKFIESADEKEEQTENSAAPETIHDRPTHLEKLLEGSEDFTETFDVVRKAAQPQVFDTSEEPTESLDALPPLASMDSKDDSVNGSANNGDLNLQRSSSVAADHTNDTATPKAGLKWDGPVVGDLSESESQSFCVDQPTLCIELNELAEENAMPKESI